MSEIDRRTFLTGAAAVSVGGPAALAPCADATLTAAPARFYEQSIADLIVEYLHPGPGYLIQLTPKQRWKMRYREERMARKGRKDPVMESRVGTWQGVRFIEEG
jgi:hypothetical protein